MAFSSQRCTQAKIPNRSSGLHGQGVAEGEDLQRSHVLMGLEAIGFAGTDLQRLDVLLRKPHGIVLLTGPTGSGKTTTLYACLNRMNSAERTVGNVGVFALLMPAE